MCPSALGELVGLQPGKYTQNLNLRGCTCAAAADMCWEHSTGRIKHIQQVQCSKTRAPTNPVVWKRGELSAKEGLSWAQSQQ